MENSETIIEIVWEGPYDIDRFNEFNDKQEDYGVYQFYGWHPTFGQNSLLYVGVSVHQPFSNRLHQHNYYWVKDEKTISSFYIGRFGGTIQPPTEIWDKLILDAESLIIYYCTPPYNAQGKIKLSVTNTTIFNFGNPGSLPHILSSKYDESSFHKRDSGWTKFKWTP